MLSTLQRPLQGIQQQKLPDSLPFKLAPSGESAEQGGRHGWISWEPFPSVGRYSLNCDRVGGEAVVTIDCPVSRFCNRYENGAETQFLFLSRLRPDEVIERGIATRKSRTIVVRAERLHCQRRTHTST